MADNRIKVSGSALVLMALMILVLPLKWLGAAMLAATFHEACHYIALRLCRCKVYSIAINAGGAVMQVEPMSCGNELFCSLAGPLGGLSLLLLSRWMPRTAVCAAVQSFYNLLPLLPLDGGRAVYSVLRMCLQEELAERVYRFISVSLRVLLSVLGFCGTVVWNLGLLPLLLVAVVFVRTIFENCLAKSHATGYNSVTKI